jgi:hypothetical protein
MHDIRLFNSKVTGTDDLKSKILIRQLVGMLACCIHSFQALLLNAQPKPIYLTLSSNIMFSKEFWRRKTINLAFLSNDLSPRLAPAMDGALAPHPSDAASLASSTGCGDDPPGSARQDAATRSRGAGAGQDPGKASSTSRKNPELNALPRSAPLHMPLRCLRRQRPVGRCACMIPCRVRAPVARPLAGLIVEKVMQPHRPASPAPCLNFQVALGHHAFGAGVLVRELTETPDLSRAETEVVATPAIEGVLRDAVSTDPAPRWSDHRDRPPSNIESSR